MSLKTRLRISIVTLVTFMVLMPCLAILRITAEDKFQDTLERSQGIAEQARYQVQQRVNEKVLEMRAAPADFDAARQLVHKIVSEDPALTVMLLKLIAASKGVVEILVCDEAGLILTSAPPERERNRLTRQTLLDFATWKERPLWDRIAEVVRAQSKDYAIIVPLGMGPAYGDKPIVTIQVVVSSVLIREAIIPRVAAIGGVCLLSVLTSLVLAYLFSNFLLKSLDRLSERISGLASGQFTPPDKAAAAKEPKEFADMTSKLEVLSQQFRGAKEDMNQLRTNIERMLERLEEGVLLFDPDHRLLRASRSAELMLALNQEQLAGKKLQELFPVFTPLGGLLRDAIAKGEPLRDAPLTLERGDAGPLRLLVNVELLESLPQTGRFSVLLTLRDAETRRQLRSQLDISTRLAAISRLTGGVAHEIKNPLNAMALHLEILKSKLEGESRVDNELKVIGGEISRLDRVVKTFLDFTRPVDLRLKTLNLVEVARQVAALVWPGAEHAGVSVELDAVGATVLIRGDEDLVKQALLNVVNNGIEAMKKGGRLKIHVERVDDEAVVSVTDQGAGIPREIRDKIFNLYFTTKEKGSGIGLAMTFRIIQLHNATLELNSEPGVGTTFRMRFPVADADARAGSAVAITPVAVPASESSGGGSQAAEVTKP